VGNPALGTESAEMGSAPRPVCGLPPVSTSALLPRNSAFLTAETVEQNTDNNKKLKLSKKNPSFTFTSFYSFVSLFFFNN